MEEVRVRFPPSPTGYLHIGSARTALCNWLFARQRGGKLVLRIEDTDVERSTEASSREILEGLEWLAIDWDEGPYRQTEHAEQHREVAEQLIERGAAYRDYLTRQELEQRREAARAEKREYRYDPVMRELSAEQRAQLEAEGRASVVRFRVPEDETIVFDDLVFGRYEMRTRDIEDFVVVRSNGVPLYVLSNVVDDHRDRISHVIRGADHLINTPKQILIYRAMGWEVPTFGHLPLTLDPKKAKISKRRHGEVVAVSFYREHGFLPEALSNFVVLLGWSPGDDREIFLSREELQAAFDIGRISRSNAVFNYRKGDPKFITDPKALHINAQHIRQMDIAELARHVQPHLQRAGVWREQWAEGGEGRQWFCETLELIRVRYHLLTDFATRGRAFFSDEPRIEIEPKAEKKLRKDPALAELLPQLGDRFDALERFDLESTESALRELAEERQVKAGLLINGTRAAVSGQAVGPGLFELLVAVGKQRTVARLRAVPDYL